MLPPKELVPLLNLLLTLLTVHSTKLDLGADPPECQSPVQPITQSLEGDHDVDPGLTNGLISLFGKVEGDIWHCDVKRVVREVGKGLLEGLRPEGSTLDSFLDRWKETVGEGYEGLTDVKALAVSNQCHTLHRV
jgi:hypothetical protein